MNWGDVSSWVAVAVSVAVLIRAIVSERRAKASADKADSQRRRSAEAVEAVAAAIRDVATSSEAPALLNQGPTWDIEHRSGSLYALINKTPFDQTEVTLTGVPVHRGAGPHDEIKAFSEIEFFGLSTWQMSDQTIIVNWTDQNGDRQEWSKPLPPKR